MDDVDDLSTVSTTHTSKLSSDHNMTTATSGPNGTVSGAGAANPAIKASESSGVKYRRVGKTGLKVSHVALGEIGFKGGAVGKHLES